MEPYDLIMLAILGVSVFFGFLKGFAWQIASVAAFAVSYFVAAQFHQATADYFAISPFVAMFGLFILTSLAIWIQYGFVHRQIERMQLKSFDRQIGAIVGLGSGLVICLIATFFSMTIFVETMGQKVVQSKSGAYIAKVIDQLDGVLPEGVQEKIQPYLKELDDKLTNARDNPPSQSSQTVISQESKDGSQSISEEEQLIKEIEKLLNE
ncbi:MAG: CvpA family protein [Pirellulaceae bacterium]|jgi:membrane protein required for colicin V production|nr:CvpA family protein [Pirellulaceae bacterium]